MTDVDSTTSYPSLYSPSRLKRVGSQVFASVGRDRLMLIAAGISFYSLLAIFPAIAALVALYGIFADTATIADHLQFAQSFMPSGAYEILTGQINEMTRTNSGALGIASLVAILLALWSAKAGVNAMIDGLNIVYGVNIDEQRGFVKRIGASLGLTVLLIGLAIVMLTALVVVPAVVAVLPIGNTGETLAEALRWPIAAFAVLIGIGALYRYGPARRARTGWISIGSILATLLWAAGSALFSYYVAQMANYNETYGSLGALVSMLLWFFLSALIVLLGAEVNAAIRDSRTKRD